MPLPSLPSRARCAAQQAQTCSTGVLNGAAQSAAPQGMLGKASAARVWYSATHCSLPMRTMPLLLPCLTQAGQRGGAAGCGGRREAQPGGRLSGPADG